MNPSDTARLLAAIRILDERLLINEPLVQSWSVVLPDWLSLDDALEATKEHYQRTNSKIMPSDVINGCRARRKTQPIITCDLCDGVGLVYSTEIRNGYEQSYARYCDCQHNDGD